MSMNKYAFGVILSDKPTKRQTPLSCQGQPLERLEFPVRFGKS
jgi:hypothetical protein